MDDKDYLTLDRAKEIFVTRDECNKQTAEVDAKVDAVNIRLAVIETKLAVIMWMLTAVGGGVIGILLNLLFGGK